MILINLPYLQLVLHSRDPKGKVIPILPDQLLQQILAIQPQQLHQEELRHPLIENLREGVP